jgi:hypothetical protein
MRAGRLSRPAKAGIRASDAAQTSTSELIGSQQRVTRARVEYCKFL